MKLFQTALKEGAVFPLDRKKLVSLRATDPYFNEIIKGLRAKVEYKMDSLGLRVMAVTSAIAGEGKTLTAVQLAANMAMTGRKKVLLMDMDLRKSSLARELKMSSSSGLTEYLSGSAPREKIIQPSVIPGLSVIAGGATLSAPTDLLAGDRFRSLVHELRDEFDLVLIDTPPVLPVSDAVTVSELVDAFVLVFRFNHTPVQMFRQALEELDEGKILGVVLNGELKKSNKYYHKYYGKYYQGVNS